jgi:hypothetical protein
VGGIDWRDVVLVALGASGKVVLDGVTRLIQLARGKIEVHAEFDTQGKGNPMLSYRQEKQGSLK